MTENSQSRSVRAMDDGGETEHKRLVAWIVAEPHTKAWPPQNFKKLIYSMYIIYILKNVACKN